MGNVRGAGRTGLVVTALGPDRPGLVNRLAAFVGRAGCNIEDARMAKLGGEFAVLVFVTGSTDALSNLEAGRADIERELSVTCFMKPTTDALPGGDSLVYHLTASGLDRPGIVESVSEVLASRSINVASLTSRVTYAPWSGTPVFQLEAELQVPSGVPLRQLKDELTDACARENLDFTLEPRKS